MKIPQNYFASLTVDRDDHEDPNSWCPPLDPRVDYRVGRRAAVRLIGLSAIAGAIGCGTGGTVAPGSTATSTAAASTVTTLTPSATSVTTGASMTVSATVSPAAATGSVAFYNGSTLLGTSSLSAGSATLTTSFSTAGTETLKAVYAGSTSYATSTSATVSVSVTGTSSASCSQTLEGEEGPYFVNDSATGYNRSNILSNLDGTEIQAGVPFVLTLYVYDEKNGCVPMQNVQVDIWHCNASGVYSAETVESTSTKSWLRGYQLTDATGKVTFTTIIPGWYQGRTTHIHLRLRSTYDSTSSGGTNTMQLFFDQNLVDTLDTTVAPYAAEGKNTTTNASDHVYTGEESGTTLMTLTGSTATGYAATAKAYLPIA